MKKIFGLGLFFIILVGVFTPTIFVVAQESNTVLAPNDPLCWTKEACEEARKKMAGDNYVQSSGGWIQSDPCFGEYGKCLPSGVTKTQISFGSDDQFTDAGQYIKKVYEYSIVAIGIVAVIMIIISGFQWITSAGNSETVTSSQKRIKGAVIGLLIAYMSFNILNSVNPATVNFRLPQVWMVSGNQLERGNEVKEGEYCDPSGKDEETKASCEKDGTKKCFKVVRSDGGAGLCYRAAQLVAIAASGGMAATAVAGTVVSSAILNGLSTAGRIGVNTVRFTAKISLKILKKLGYSAIKNAAKIGVVAGAEKVVTGDAELTISAIKLGAGLVAYGGSAAYEYMTEDEKEDFKEYRNGLCLDKIENNLVNGQMCNTTGNQCASGKCVDQGSGLECWLSSVNGKMGICSEGKLNDICNSISDCNTKNNPKLECRKNKQGIKYCSDGSNLSYCSNDNECISSNCNKGKCIGEITEDGDWCSSHIDCGKDSGCYAMVDCGTGTKQPIYCGNSCRSWDKVKNELYTGVDQDKTGICIPDNYDTGSLYDKFTAIKYKYESNELFAPATEDGKMCEGY